MCARTWEVLAIRGSPALGPQCCTRRARGLIERRRPAQTGLEESRASENGHAERFKGRAEDYSKNRPRYPRKLLRILENELEFRKSDTVADIGSGTGILSELFLRNGNLVYCVEPNRDMRRVAEERLKRYAPRFVSVDGTAESTRLEDRSVDLITVGQALHWFDLEKARVEFARILRKEGYVSIVYNRRRKEGRVEEAYGRVTRRFGKNRAAIPKIDDTYVAAFLKNKGFKKFVMPNSQSLGLRGMLGRLASASYMPPQGAREWIRIEKEVTRIFDEHAEGGILTLRYNTVMYLGRVRL